MSYFNDYVVSSSPNRKTGRELPAQINILDEILLERAKERTSKPMIILKVLSFSQDREEASHTLLTNTQLI